MRTRDEARVEEIVAFETWGRQQGNVNEGDLAIAACRAKVKREMAEAELDATKMTLRERAAR